MKWSAITALGASSLGMAAVALLLAGSAIPQALTLDDPTASVSQACERGQVAQCAKDRERARDRVSLMFNAAGFSLLGSLLLGGMGTLGLAQKRRKEREEGPEGPLLLGPKWEQADDAAGDSQDQDDLFRR